MKKILTIAIAAFGAGTLFSSCCCNDADAPKLPNQPKFRDIPTDPVPVAPVKVAPSKK